MKSRYKKWIQEHSVPVFCTDWWLDAACGEHNWDVAGYSNANGLEVFWPFHIKRKWGMKVIVMPKLTQKLDLQSNYTERDDIEKGYMIHEAMTTLIKQLPSVHYMDQAMQLPSAFAIPLVEKGYVEKIYYTYVIPNLSDMDAVLARFSKSKRKDARKGQGQFDIRYEMSPMEWYDFHQMSLSKQGKQISYTKNFFGRVAHAALQRNSGRIMCAVDHEGKIHSALFMIWDESRAYLLLSCYDPDLKTSRSFPYLLLKAIEEASKHTKMFDFEGSMIKGVEAENRQFGAEQEVYSVISKSFSFPSHLKLNWQRMKRVVWSFSIIIPSLLGLGEAL